jgi:lipoyl(octanoyl) transferase
MRNLEEVMLRVAASYGVQAQRVEGITGAFCENRKFGAVGVRISRWVTMHGFALNVTTDLDAFRLIVPCGLSEVPVTSLAREAGHDIALREVMTRATQSFVEVFDYRFHGPE